MQLESDDTSSTASCTSGRHLPLQSYRKLTHRQGHHNAFIQLSEETRQEDEDERTISTRASSRRRPRMSVTSDIGEPDLFDEEPLPLVEQVWFDDDQESIYSRHSPAPAHPVSPRRP